MRQEFIRALTELAATDPRVALLTGDLGFWVVEPFAQRFPERFVNAGVAEQNMVGVATGLAEAGFVPFVYSITPFAVLRPYEFIRNGPLAHRLPVRIIGVGDGMDYGTNGASHFALEDLALMRILPGMTTVAPCDGEQAVAALRATASTTGPVYFRLAKDRLPPVPGLEGRFTVGRAELLERGSDVILFGTGKAAHSVVAAAEILRRRGLRPSVAVLASLSPIDRDDLARMVGGHRAVVTVENHLVHGGLGSLLCETVGTAGLGARVLTLGVDSWPMGPVGAGDYMRSRYSLGPEQVAARTVEWLDG